MDNRELILETALDLFYTRGYDAVGVQEIAERSGVTKPTLYYYFKSKYGLLEQLLESRGKPFLEELTEACVYHGDVRGTLCAAARVIAQMTKRDPRFASLFVALYHSARGNEAYQAVRPYALALQNRIQGIFESAAHDLGNMHGRQRQFSVGFIGLVIYAIMVKVEETGEEGRGLSDEEIEGLVHQFMHGINS